MFQGQLEFYAARPKCFEFIVIGRINLHILSYQKGAANVNKKSLRPFYMTFLLILSTKVKRSLGVVAFHYNYNFDPFIKNFN